MPSAAYTAKVTALAPENCCDRKMPSGTIGFSLACLDQEERDERRRRRRPRRRPRARSSRAPGPSISAYTTPARPTVSSALPTTSRCAPACSSRDSGTWRIAISDRDRRDRQVDDEHPAPRHRVDEVAAEERPDRGGDAAEARPRADGAAAVRRSRTTPTRSPGCSARAAPPRRPAGSAPRSASRCRARSRTAATSPRTRRAR